MNSEQSALIQHLIAGSWVDCMPSTARAMTWPRETTLSCVSLARDGNNRAASSQSLACFPEDDDDADAFVGDRELIND